MLEAEKELNNKYGFTLQRCVHTVALGFFTIPVVGVLEALDVSLKIKANQSLYWL